MQKKWQVVSPRVVAETNINYGIKLFIVISTFILLIGLFTGGYFFGRHELVPLRHANHDLRREIQTLQEEVRGVANQNVDLRQEIANLELTRKIDQEALRVAQENHKELQESSLELEKDLSALKRLVRKGKGGYLKIKNFSLRQGGEPNLFLYNFIVMKLIEDTSESEGKIIIRILGVIQGKPVSKKLDELLGSDPFSQNMDFKYFQDIRGTLRIPENMTPEAVEIELIPTTKSLASLKEKFIWIINE